MTLELEKALDGLNKIDERLSAICKDVEKGAVAQEVANKTIAELGEQQKLLSQQLLDVQQKSHHFCGESAAQRTLGSQVVLSESYKSFKENHRTMSVVIANKGAGDPVLSSQAKLPAYRIPGVVPSEERELQIEALIPSLPISENSVEFVREKTFTNGAATVAEGAQKPATEIVFEASQTPVQVIAHWTKITRQLADDAPALAAFINARMVYGVDLATENQILTGNGTTPQLSGLMNTGNFVAQSFKLADIGGAGSTLLDLLRLSIATVNSNGYRANAIVLNPMDWALLQGIKGTNGEYLLGSAANSFAMSTVWGLPVVASASMTKGKYLVGDFARAATIYDRMQTVVDIATQNDTDFVKNLYTIRAERRVALAVTSPKALIGGNLTVPAS